MRTLLGVFRLLVAACVTLVSAVLAILLLPVDGGRGHVFHSNARLWARTVLAVCGVRVRVLGLETIDRAAHYVYVSNHASLFDIPCVIAALPGQVRIVYKKELEVIPFFGWGLKWGSYIAIERGRSARAMKSLDAAIQKIRRGTSVLLFAEGTRTRTGRLQPFKRGAFNLAARAGVPVVPLTINGTYGILRRRSLVVRPGLVELILDHPITVNGDRTKDAEVDLLNRVHGVISRHYSDQT